MGRLNFGPVVVMPEARRVPAESATSGPGPHLAVQHSSRQIGRCRRENGLRPGFIPTF